MPRWLWPDAAVEDWTAALERIAAIVSEVMSHGHSAQILEGDPEAIGIAGYTSGMGPPPAHWLEADQITTVDERIAAPLDLHLRHNRIRMHRMAMKADELSHTLSSAGVRHTFQKGMHTAYTYFPEPGARPLSEIDLFVAPEDEGAADKALHACGFQSGMALKFPRERNWRNKVSPAEPRTLCFVPVDERLVRGVLTL